MIVQAATGHSDNHPLYTLTWGCFTVLKINEVKITVIYRWLAMFIAIVTGIVSTCAQEADILFGRFESRFVKLDSLIHYPTRVSSDYKGRVDATGLLPAAQALDTAFVDSVIDNRVKAQITAAHSVTGLSMTGQIYGRLDEGFGLDEDDALSRYKGKIQADIRWNVFGSSLINRKGRANEIRLRGEISKLDYRREDIGRLVVAQKEQFRRHYDNLLSAVLIHRIDNLALLDDALSYMLREGAISSDDLLQVLNDKAEAERLMASIAEPAPAAADLSAPGGVVVTVDSTALISYIRRYNVETSSLVLRQQLLEQQIANTSYWTTLNISPFVRYSYYMRPVIDNSSNIDAGVSFIIPISGETSRKRRAMQAERDVLALETDRVAEVLTDNIRLILLDIDRMNRSISGEVKRLDDLKRYLLIRKNAYDGRIGQYNYLDRMKEYNAYILCCERLLSFSYQRDCMLASLQMYLPDVSILEFCTETEARPTNVQ